MVIREIVSKMEENETHKPLLGHSVEQLNYIERVSIYVLSAWFLHSGTECLRMDGIFFFFFLFFSLDIPEFSIV